MVAEVGRSRLREAIVEMADDMHRHGIIDDCTHYQIAMRMVKWSVGNRGDRGEIADHGSNLTLKFHKWSTSHV
jgi:hypothetical protein